MKRDLKYSFVACCCVAQTLTAWPIAADQVPAKPAEAASALAVIERPRNSVEFRDAYRTILEHASESKLRELRKAKSLPLALGAAWKAALQSCAGDRNSPSRATFAFSRFVGFVDGRLPIELPEWWERTVAGAVLMGKEGDSVLVQREPTPMARAPNIPQVPKYPEMIALPQGWSASQIPAGLELRMQKTWVAIPMAIPKDASGWRTELDYFGMLSALIDGDSAYVVIGTGDAYRPELLAKVSRRAGKVLWERRIWTGGDLTGIALSGPHGRVHVVESKMGRDGNVYVFGATVFGAYIESFSATDGTPQLRFCTLALQEWF
jgi:hypothetical protein